MNCVFICVNFNGAPFTEKFLASVQALDDRRAGLRATSIVVDNDSNVSDFTVLEEASEKYENARIIRSDLNLGYFGGLNLGLSILDHSDFDYIIVGNNDLTFASNFLQELSLRSYHSDVLVVAPNVVTSDGYHQNPHCTIRVSTIRKFLFRLYYLDYNIACFLTWGAKILKALQGGRRKEGVLRPQYIHMGIGACYVLPKAFFQHYDRLDDSVFLYGEEALLAGQVMAVGGRTYYDNLLIVSHAESATLSKLPSKTTYKFAKASYPKYQSFL